MDQTKALILAVLLGTACGQLPVAVPGALPANYTPTTTQTAWDSSAFSSASSGGSSGFSKSVIDVSGSSDAPDGSSQSFDSDPSGSFSWAGSEQSGSSGFYLRLYLWFLVGAVCCCVVLLFALAIFMAAPQKKKKGNRNQVAPPLPPPEPEMQDASAYGQQPQEPVYTGADLNNDTPDALQMAQPLMAPLPTYSTPIPSYSSPAVNLTMPPATIAMPMAGSSYIAGGLPATTSYATAPYAGSTYITAANAGVTYEYAQPTTYAGGAVV